jgi:hypothetical protein
MWTGELIDVAKGGDIGNEDLYLRLAGLSSIIFFLLLLFMFMNVPVQDFLC